ncbi:MAG: hypothetical protein ACD_7C00459G0006 [uncultured bacterium]|nr:MAG: hypothetical protein ACD_7C00459G0006 [uncultured bacterium]
MGKKTAERVILELQNKVADMPMGERQEIAVDSEMIEVLMSMGYSAFQAREAIKSIPKDIEKIEDKIKFALKEMGK